MKIFGFGYSKWTVTVNINLWKSDKSVSKVCVFINELGKFVIIKDTHKEKAQSNKTPALTKSTNMDIWVVATSNQLLIRGS